MTALFRPFQTLLIANRGEIAVRIMRTARRMGIRTVAIYSEADRLSPHVTEADAAVCVGAAGPRESYLNIEAILRAAHASGADAVHPGYGFLAENEDFAQAVQDAGLVFVGPSPEAIRAMGNKAEAKRLMLAAQMPCVPGYQGEDQSDPTLIAAANDIGYPLMVKATAGGGGRGMRLVHNAADLPSALASARSEALAAFGSDELILERAVIEPRHIEIQIFADSQGHAIHLGERDCSVQRRHQKLIEEAPSPAVSEELRARMGQAAVDAAKAIQYVGAGTMEFLLDRSGAFFFMEMNTRLQVEHAVTEAITRLDLVEWQLRVAAGERLPLEQKDVVLQGHSIEVRLTAEDVPAGFLPQSGPLLRWRPPGAGHDVRVDHALIEGGSIPAHYDSMIAKLVTHGRNREDARRKLRLALQDCALLGIATNQSFLIDCLENTAFAAGDVNTGFIAQHMGESTVQPHPCDRLVALAALFASGWPLAGAEQLSRTAYTTALEFDRKRWNVQIRPERNGVAAKVHRADATDGEPSPELHLSCLHTGRDGTTTVECDGRIYRVLHALDGNAVHVFIEGRAWHLTTIDPRKARAKDGGDGAVSAPLAGRIAAVHVKVGDSVQNGQVLVVLEAMKMEHSLCAPFAGQVTELLAQVGGQARSGGCLVQVVPLETAAQEQSA